MVLGSSFSRDTQHVNHLLTGVSPKPPKPLMSDIITFSSPLGGPSYIPRSRKKKGSWGGGLTKMPPEFCGKP